MTSLRSSVLLSGRLRCVDPLRSLLQAVLVMAVALGSLVALPGDVVPVVAALTITVVGASFIAVRDRRRPMCTSLLLRDCEVLDVVWADAILQATLTARGGRVSFLGSSWGLRRSRRARSGTRRVPVAVVSRSSQVRWQDGPVEVPLEEDDEILGALSVVTRGENVQVEAIYGTFPSRPAHLLAVRIASSEGAIQSWEPGLVQGPRRSRRSRRGLPSRRTVKA